MSTLQILSKSGQIEQKLRKELLSGVWQLGARLPSDEVLLKRFGVSRAPLREAMCILARDGLIERRQGSGTYATKSLQRAAVCVIANTNTIASSESYFLRKVLEEARKHIRGSDRQVMSGFGHGDTLPECLDSIEFLQQPTDNDAVVGVLSTLPLGTYRDRLDQSGIPVVTFESGVPSGAHAVVLDYARMTEMATQALLAHGYDEFALMYTKGHEVGKNSPDAETASLLAQLVDKAVAGNRERLLPVLWSWDLHDAYRVFKEVWSRPKRPRAVFFYDDAVCHAATRAILELGIKVPDELAIITHSNVGRQFHFPVALTRVEFDPAEGVAAAWAMLSSLMDERTVENPVVYIQPRLREGASL